MVCHFRNYVIKDTRASEKENQLPCHELPYGSGKELTRSIRVGLEMDSPAVMSLDSNLWETKGKSSGEGNGNPLQYSCLENPMDRGAWLATVHEVAKSQT